MIDQESIRPGVVVLWREPTTREQRSLTIIDVATYDDGTIGAVRFQRHDGTHGDGPWSQFQAQAVYLCATVKP